MHAVLRVGLALRDRPLLPPEYRWMSTTVPAASALTRNVYVDVPPLGIIVGDAARVMVGRTPMNRSPDVFGSVRTVSSTTIR